MYRLCPFLFNALPVNARIEYMWGSAVGWKCILKKKIWGALSLCLQLHWGVPVDDFVLLGQPYLFVELGRPLECFVELLKLWCCSLSEHLLYFCFQVFAKVSFQFIIFVLDQLLVQERPCWLLGQWWAPYRQGEVFLLSLCWWLSMECLL